ncbi:MAG: hypothetical protein ACREUI_01675 [Burkholderiales bacterium]
MIIDNVKMLFILSSLYNMPKPLSINNRLHSQHKIYSKQTKSTKTAKDSRDVWQDKRAFHRARMGVVQPASLKKGMRAQRFDNAVVRIQNKSVPKRRTVQLTLWVNPIVKAELQRIAEQEGVSVSTAGAALLEKAVQTNLDMQYGALLQPIIEQAIHKHIRAMATRLSWLLVRIAFDSGQTRVLTTNLLGMQDAMTEENLKEILATADKRTKANLTRKTPQLTELMEAVEKWLLEGEAEEERGSKTN